MTLQVESQKRLMCNLNLKIFEKMFENLRGSRRTKSQKKNEKLN